MTPTKRSGFLKVYPGRKEEGRNHNMKWSYGLSFRGQLPDCAAAVAVHYALYSPQLKLRWKLLCLQVDDVFK